MIAFRHLVVSAAFILAGNAFAQTAAEHKEHHPAVSATSPAAAMPDAQEKKVMLQMKGMDEQMKMMREMHAKMMASKTPEERMAMMADHVKLMQSGMEMMEQMKSDMSGEKMKMPAAKGKAMAKGMGQGMSMEMCHAMPMHQMMEKRMEMMEGMMQMMMDRMSMSK